MAKKKYNGLSSKHFFNIVVLSASALGLMLAVMVVQKPTNTRSDASGCTKKPDLILNTRDGNKYPNENFVVYELKLINNCPNPKRFNITVNTPKKPVYYQNWRWNLTQGDKLSPDLKNQTLLTKFIENNDTILFTAARPANVANTMRKEDYKYFTVRASLEKNSNIYDDIYLIYTVE